MELINFYRTASFLSATFVALCAGASAFAANESIGVNAAVKGDVTIQSGEQKAKQAVIKKPVLLGDVVNSNRVGSLQVLLKDQTMFTVGPDCNLTIDKFVYDPTKNSNSMSASVKQGMFRFMSGNISKSGPDSVSINTPVASMGIRGTMVEGLIGPEAIQMALNAGVISSTSKVDQQNASLFVLRGPGRKNSSKNRLGVISITSAGKTVVVKNSGMAVFVSDKASAPSKPFMLLEADSDVFHTKLRTRPKAGQSYNPFTLDAGQSPSLQRVNAGRSQQADFVNPVTDLQWPTDLDLPQDIPDVCTPLNPNFPSCQ